jgi:hypothetical protein
MVELIESDPDIYLDEIVDVIADIFGTCHPTSTIWNTLEWVGVTRKRYARYITLI